MSTTLRDYTKKVFASGDCSDFSIIVFDDNGTQVEKKVHKFMLRRSAFFSAMLGIDSKEAQEGRVTIDHISSNTMDNVLQYLYTDELSAFITMGQAIKIASAADYLQLDALKTAAINQWKKTVCKRNPSDALTAFRAFADASLRVTPSDSEWHDIMEYVDSFLDLAKESTAFIELIIGYFGTSHPYLSMDLLAKWTLGEDTILTDAVSQARKKAAAELIKKINLQNKISLRTLAKLSKSAAYPSDYMLQQIQKKADRDDESVSGEVVYTILTTKNRTVELEHETGYVLFQFKGFEDARYPNDEEFWQFLHSPTKCKTAVAIVSPQTQKDYIWWDGSPEGGTLSEQYHIASMLDDNKAITIKITLKKQVDNNGLNTPSSQVHNYKYNFVGRM